MDGQHAGPAPRWFRNWRGGFFSRSSIILKAISNPLSRLIWKETILVMLRRRQQVISQTVITYVGLLMAEENLAVVQQTLTMAGAYLLASEAWILWTCKV